ncbi:hypothetical protein VNO77_01446 [Canavalia gladiata]|uniref:Uncharacterized protein n=1 Tax=Canavalia gladiata TaxID=3824 RepID=A0AAN9MT45_CANGL
MDALVRIAKCFRNKTLALSPSLQNCRDDSARAHYSRASTLRHRKTTRAKIQILLRLCVVLNPSNSVTASQSEIVLISGRA